MGKSYSIVAAIAAMIFACVSTARSAPIAINVTYSNGTATEKQIFGQAVSDWTGTLANPTGKTVALALAVDFQALAIGNGGSTTGFNVDADKLPTSSSITMSNNTDMYYSLDPAVPATKKDALTVARHEICHALGFGMPFDLYSAQADTAAVPPTWTKGTVTATLAGTSLNDASHLDATAHPNDIVNLTVGLGNRRSISNIDVKILTAAFGYNLVPEPASLSLLAAALMLGFGRLRPVAA